MSEQAYTGFGAMPEPSAIFALAAAAFLEMERTDPGFIERVRLRLENESNVSGAVRLRGPRSEPAVRNAIAQALAWTAILTAVGELEAPAPKKRLLWGWL